MSTRASSEDDPNHKRRKIYRACEACVHSKTRCENVTPEGCSLCRRRKKECSLAEAGPSRVPDGHPAMYNTFPYPPYLPGPPSRPPIPPSSYRPYPPPDIGEARDPAIAHLEGRMRAMEEELELLRNKVDSASVTQRTPQHGSSATRRPSDQHIGDGIDPERVRVPLAELQNRQNIFYGDTLFSIRSSINPFPSVIELGLFNHDQVSLAFHSFKHSIAPVCPLSTWLSTATATPTHPFLILAIMHHLPPFASSCPQLSDLVDESLLLVLRGETGLEVMMALLVMALAPPIMLESEVERAHILKPRPSSLRFITMAYEMGRDMGLHIKAHHTARSTSLGDLEWRDALHQLEVWNAVTNKYNLLQILFGHPETLAPDVDYNLSDSASSIQRQCYEQRLCDRHLTRIAWDVLAFTFLMERDVHDDQLAEGHMRKWESAMGKLEQFSSDERLNVTIRLDAACCCQTLLFRMVIFIVKMPIPLTRPREVHRPSLVKVVPSCLTVVRLLINEPDETPSRFTLPHYVATVGAVACTMLLATVAVCRGSRQNFPVETVEPKRLKPLVRLLKQSSPTLRLILEMVEQVHGSAESVDNLPVHDGMLGATAINGQIPAQQYHPHESHMRADLQNGLDPMLAPLFDMDHFGWDFLLPDWTPGVGQMDPQG